MKLSLAVASTLLAAPCAAVSIKSSVQGKLATGTTSAGLPIEIAECTVSGGCTTSTKNVVLDQNWLWYTTDPDGKGEDCDPTAEGGYYSDSCTLVQPESYDTIYGISTEGNALHLPYYFTSPYGSEMKGNRLYLIDSDSSYTTFKMLGKEISFDVELSTLPCGFNAAVYFVDMDADGGDGQGPGYGTGYCDAQCPSDLKTTPSGTPNSDGTSVCCQEMDLFEANTEAMAMTPHPCQYSDGSDMSGPYVCTSDAECASGESTGVCDGSGCDFNPYRNGDKTFYGPGSGFAVDSTQTMTVTTQFLTDTSGDLSEIAQIYTVNGAVVHRDSVTLAGSSYDSVTADYCASEATAFNQTSFEAKGGLSTMASALDDGMVFVLSLWNDETSHMLWLDGTSGSGDGAVRGPCGTTDDSDNTDAVEAAKVTYSNIKYGEIGSTFDEDSTAAPTAPTTPTAPSAAPTASPTTGSDCTTPSVAQGAQCAYGSITGQLCCAEGYVCCDNGGAPGQYASCQTESYCTGADAANCESDGQRTTPCTIVGDE